MFKTILLDYRDWVTAAVPGAPGNNIFVDRTIVRYLGGQNPRSCPYMEFDRASTNAAGAFIDPWKNVYKVAVGNGSVTPNGFSALFRDVAAWSIGKDAVSPSPDDVMSW